MYIRRSRGRGDPILDLTLLRDTDFRLSVIGGSLVRLTQGAQPFLLPLMMQIGFGVSAARRGTITLAVSVGSLAMTSMAARIPRRFGFRGARIWNGLIATIGYALSGFFGPQWPVRAMFAPLRASGFFMSFRFTADSTIAHDGVEPHRMSSATASARPSSG